MESLDDLQARISKLELEKKELKEKLDRLKVGNLRALRAITERTKKELEDKLYSVTSELEKLYIEFQGAGPSDNVADPEEFGGGADDR